MPISVTSDRTASASAPSPPPLLFKNKLSLTWTRQDDPPWRPPTKPLSMPKEVCVSKCKQECYTDFCDAHCSSGVCFPDTTYTFHEVQSSPYNYGYDAGYDAGHENGYKAGYEAARGVKKQE